MPYKPQFAFPTPPGFRDEPFLLPFTFTIPGSGQLQRQLPWQLDDDQPFLIRGIYFTAIGIRGAFNSGAAALCRIWDSTGNPLSKDLILTLGMWANAGTDTANQNYVGFPIEPEVPCAPGGVLMFDFQQTTTALVASFQINPGPSNIIFQAGVIGAAGNGRTIALVDPGAPNIPLSVGVAGVNVTVTLATDGGGAITSTYSQIAAAINASSATFGVMSAWFQPDSDPTTVAVALGPTALTGGAASTPITLNGTLYGLKRFRDC